MQLDIPALVSSLSDDQPSGPDLSYDDARVTIESAFERSISDGGEAAEGPDWRKVIGQITAQAELTRDVWLPVYLMRAAASAQQFDLLAESAEYLAALLEERWADAHPQLDEYGFIGRKTPCESLTRIRDFLGPLVRVPLLQHPRFGRFSGEDLERFAEKGAAVDGYAAFRATLDATAQEDIDTLVERFDGLRAAIRRVDAVLTANAEGDTATNFRPTYDVLDRLRGALVKVLPGQAVAEPTDADDASTQVELDGGAGSGSIGAGAGVAFTGAIRSRDDVVRAIDAICAYYAACEPTSPVPLALRRARAWTTLDFMAVLRDIAPGSLDEAGRVLLTKVGDESVGQPADWGNAADAVSSTDSEW